MGLETGLNDVLDTPAAGPLVIRGGVLRAAGYVAGVLVSVGAVAVMTRHLGVGDFGRFITVVSLVTIVGTLTEAGTTNLGIREFATRDEDQRAHLMRNLLGMRIALTVAGAAAAVGFALLAGYDGTMVLGTAIGAAGLFAATFQTTFGVPLAAHLRLGLVSLIDFLRQAATAILAVVLVAAGAGLLPFLCIPPAAALLALLVTVPAVWGQIPLRPSFDRAEWARLARVTAAFAAATAVGTIYVYLTVVLMSLITSEEQTGYFGASFRVFVVVASVAGLVVTAAFPVLSRAARDDRDRFAYAVGRVLEVSLIAGAGLALATVLGAATAIEVVGGEDFDPAAPVLRIQGLAIVASFVLAVWGFALISLHRHTALLVANGLGLVVSAAATLALVPSMEARGAALATVVAEAVVAAAYAAALFRSRPELGVPIASVGKVALAAAPAAALAAVPGLGGIPLVAAACATYAVLLLLLRAVPDELMEMIPRRRGAAGSS